MNRLEINGVPLREASPPIDLELSPGRVYAVLGGNGSGKSALARLVTGLDLPMSGQVLLGESAMSVADGAFVYQTFINYPSFTVRENLIEPARRLPANERESRLKRVVDVLGLGDLLSRRPSELSGGQQQRVAIGRAVMKGAAVLALDEPLVNLDFALRDELMTRLNELLHGQDTIVVYATSVASEAMTVADELILLDDQRVIQQGEPLAVYRDPTSRRAADLTSVPRTNWLPADIAQALCNGESLGRAVGFRPEHLSLEPASGAHRFEAEVVLVETDGTSVYVHVVFGDEEWVVKAPISATTLALEADARVTLFAAESDRIECDG